MKTCIIKLEISDRKIECRLSTHHTSRKQIMSLNLNNNSSMMDAATNSNNVEAKVAGAKKNSFAK
jgi:hypothetical protein